MTDKNIAKKEKAIELLKEMDIYAPYIKGFHESDKVCFFERFGGYWAEQEPELYEKMKSLEKKYKCLVYAITHEYTEYCSLLCLLKDDCALVYRDTDDFGIDAEVQLRNFPARFYFHTEHIDQSVVLARYGHAVLHAGDDVVQPVVRYGKARFRSLEIKARRYVTPVEVAPCIGFFPDGEGEVVFGRAIGVHVDFIVRRAFHGEIHAAVHKSYGTAAA